MSFHKQTTKAERCVCGVWCEYHSRDWANDKWPPWNMRWERLAIIRNCWYWSPFERLFVSELSHTLPDRLNSKASVSTECEHCWRGQQMACTNSSQGQQRARRYEALCPVATQTSSLSFEGTRLWRPRACGRKGSPCYVLRVHTGMQVLPVPARLPAANHKDNFWKMGGTPSDCFWQWLCPTVQRTAPQVPVLSQQCVRGKSKEIC